VRAGLWVVPTWTSRKIDSPAWAGGEVGGEWELGEWVGPMRGRLAEEISGEDWVRIGCGSGF